MNLKRITRLLKLLQTLQSGQGQNAEGLAEACGVSRRTIFRDLETLKEAGVPLSVRVRNAAVHQSLVRSFCHRPTLRRKKLCRSLPWQTNWVPTSGLPFYGPARQAALKLENSLPAALREELHTKQRSIQIEVGPINPLPGKEPFYQQLVDAIANQTVLRMKYGSLTEWETISLKLRPYQLLFRRRSWYVIGRSSMHREVRTFNISRIVTIKPLKREVRNPSHV